MQKVFRGVLEKLKWRTKKNQGLLPANKSMNKPAGKGVRIKLQG